MLKDNVELEMFYFKKISKKREIHANCVEDVFTFSVTAPTLLLITYHIFIALLCRQD